MGYVLGVDLGTTYTAAATLDIDTGDVRMLGLGNRALQIPSVLYRRSDGEFLVGEVAERNGLADPTNMVREFKRRIGDPVPVLVGGIPYSPQSLTARLLSWVTAQATERMGRRPESVILSHPANWTAFKLDFLREAAALADLTNVRTITEPEAAAHEYATKNSVNIDDRICVYDLGGGTFDAAVLVRTPGGFAILGAPDGIEHLGGIDFDEAVFRRVLDVVGSDANGPIAWDDEDTYSALARLRRDCSEAKEALSTEIDTVIVASLPHQPTRRVRLARSEFEDIVRPALNDTLTVMDRALRSAATRPNELAAIVLVGGSSRIPLVSETLAGYYRRPVSSNTHPKHDIALGAARAWADIRADSDATVGWQFGDPAGAPMPPGFRPGDSPATAGATGIVHPPGTAASPGTAAPPGTANTSRGARSNDQEEATAVIALPVGAASTPATYAQPSEPATPRRSLRRTLTIAAAVVASLAIIGTAIALSARSNRTDQVGAAPVASTPVEASTSVESAAISTPISTPASTPISTPVSPTAAVVEKAVLPTSAPLSDETIVAPRISDKGTDLFQIDAAGNVGTRITTGGAIGPAISPDRRTIIYRAADLGILRTVAVDGTGDRQLFDSTPEGCNGMFRPAWNPVDPTMIAVVCFDQAHVFSLKVLNLDGEVLRTVEVGQENIGDPSFSPDGTTIIYWAGPPSQAGGGSIYTVAADGSSPPVKVTEGGEGTDADPMFSPDGKTIAFRRFLLFKGEADHNLMLMSPDGSNLRTLIEGPTIDQDPTWSPDGTRIVFKSNRGEGDQVGKNQLWIIGVDGSDMHRLVPSDTKAEGYPPAWARR